MLALALHRAGIAAHAGDAAALDLHGPRALGRVRAAVRFWLWMTGVLHRFPDQTEFDQKIQEAELHQLRTLPQAQAAIAATHVGLRS